MIEKTNLLGRKPGFKWLGHQGFLQFMDVFKQQIKTKAKAKTKQVFRVWREPSNSLQPVSDLKTPQRDTRVKHFKPRVLQNIPIEQASVTQGDCVKQRKLEDGPERIVMAQPADKREQHRLLTQTAFTLGLDGAFKRLNLFLTIGQRLPQRCLGERILLDSHTPNITA